MNRIADRPIVFMGSNSAHDQCGIVRIRAKPLQNRVGQKCSRACMTVPVDNISDVVQVARNGRKLLLPGVEPDTSQNVPGNCGDQADMAKAVLRVPERAQILIGAADQGLQFGVCLHGGK